LAKNPADIFTPQAIQAEGHEFAQSEGWSPAKEHAFEVAMTEQGQNYHADPSHYFNGAPLHKGDTLDAELWRHPIGVPHAGEMAILGEGADKGVVMSVDDTSPTHRFSFMVPVESDSPGVPASVAESNAGFVSAAHQFDRISYSDATGEHTMNGDQALATAERLDGKLGANQTVGDYTGSPEYPPSANAAERALIDAVRANASNLPSDEPVIKVLQGLGFHDQ
jgi:hypothetical protein